MATRRFAPLVVGLVAVAVWGGARFWQKHPLPGSSTRAFSYGGLERSYLLHAGTAKTKRALVLLLHGLGGSGAEIERRTRFSEAAERAGVVVAYPDGLRERWNDGGQDSSADDVGFLVALASALSAEFGIDPEHVYAAGFSNGAAMVHRLACESDRFSAIAAVAGYLTEEVGERCTNRRPVSVLDVHGTADAAVFYDARLTRTVAHWVTHDGCTGPAETVRLPDRDPTDETRAVRNAHRRCRAGTEVELHTLEGGGHTWPGEARQWLRIFRPPGRISRDLEANGLILAFFARHPALATVP